MPPFDHRRRLRAFADALTRQRIGGALISHPANIEYLTGFGGHDAALLAAGKSSFLITDSRYVEEAHRRCDGLCEVTLATGSLLETVSGVLARKRVRCLGFEASHLPAAVADRLRAECRPARVVPVPALIESARAVKDGAEIAAIRRSARLARTTMRSVRRLVRPGATERSIAAAIEIAFIRRGARSSFPTIVAAGANASKPHASPAGTRIPANGYVMIDMGSCVDGYCSDITRTIAVGTPSAQMARIYDIVSEAQDRAIAMIRPGREFAAIDRAAREVIERAGYGERFGHALGHGVGLEIHEGPSVSWRNPGAAVAGMVFTVEPAIYVPGKGGVRIEDMILVTRNGCEILTR